MLNIGTQSWVYCPCSTQIDYNDVIGNPSKYNSINELSFCPSCQDVRCKYCYQREYTMKYCSSCMTDYTTTKEVHCTRNCFVCPQCESMLSVSVSNKIVDSQSGKQFTFQCVTCDYHYDSEIILKPKSVYNIVKEEYQSYNTSFFNDIRTYYKHKMNYDTLSHQLTKDIAKGKYNKKLSVSKDIMNRLKHMNINSMDDLLIEIDKLKLTIDQTKPQPFNDNGDIEAAKRVLLKESMDITTNLLPHTGTTIFKPKLNTSLVNSPKQFPVPKVLCGRTSIKCTKCHHDLLIPNEEMLSTKFNTKFNANEFLPLITITPKLREQFPSCLEPEKHYIMLLNLVNPMPYSTKVKLSTPSSFNLKDNCTVHVTLPVTHLRIGGHISKDHPIKTIPTPYLTQETKISRTELVMRLGKLNENRSNDTSTDFIESLVEFSHNWYLVPIEIGVTKASHSVQDFKIPIYCSIQCSLPESIKSLGLSKPELSFGYWCVVNLGSFTI